MKDRRNPVSDVERLQRLLGPPDLERLVERLRQRLERGRPLRGTLRLSDAGPGERRAVESLLGRRPSDGRTLAVDLDALAAILRRAGAAPDLATAVETLTGPVTDRRAAEERAGAAWESLWRRAEQQARPRGLGDWLQALRAEGLLRRLADDAATAERLLQGVWRVSDALPVHGMTLSTLAARRTGDAHGLDPGRPLATLLRRVLTTRYPDVAADSGGAHALWAAAGVRVGGGLNSRIAVLNLPASAATATGNALQALAGRGEPTWLTLRQLLEDPPDWPVRDGAVYICENIAVMAEAADRLGAAAAPLLATEGQASTAAVTLIRMLSHAGATLYYHGDFDWGGLHIANRMIGDLGVRPWRFDARAYRDAVGRYSGRPLRGRPVAARWDQGLAHAMGHAERAIDEEELIQELLADLAAERA